MGRATRSRNVYNAPRMLRTHWFAAPLARLGLLAAAALAACSADTWRHGGNAPVRRAPAEQPLPAPAGVSAQDRGTVWMLVRRLVREHRRSVVTVDGRAEASATDELRALGDRGIAGLDRLQRERDPILLELGGTFYGLLVRDLGGSSRLAPGLVDELHDLEPRHRAFACEALGFLLWADAVPYLRALLADKAAVPGYAEGTTVATFAGIALDNLRRAGADR